MNRIRLLREQKGLTQTALGKAISVSTANISKYENESLDISTGALQKLADYFQVTTDYLLGRNESNNTIGLTGNKIPKELQEIGVDYISIAKEMQDKEIPPETIREIIDIIQKTKKEK